MLYFHFVVFRSFRVFISCSCHCPCQCPECRPHTQFDSPYSPAPYPLVYDDPPTIGGFSDYGSGNSSPDLALAALHLPDIESSSRHERMYTVARTFPDIGSSSRHDDRYTVARNFPDIGSSSRHDDFESWPMEELNEITESVGQVNRGLPQWKISRLPTHTYGEITPTCGWWWEKKKKFVADDTQCSICQMNYENGDRITTLTPCNHIYHKDCISEWLKRSTVCCVCKREVRV